MKTILFVFGTRPEAIKLAPIIKIFKLHKKLFNTKVCVTAQHREMLDQVLDFFEITPDYDLNLMINQQDLFDITINCLNGLKDVYKKCNPDLVFVQGDTTTAFIGALSAFYNKIKIAHIEAGLRTKNKYIPFPEEMNRTLITHLVDFNFTPTHIATNNLYNEGITQNVFEVGNTVIDALFLGLKVIKNNKQENINTTFKDIDINKKIVLITGHRRENFGKIFENICYAIKYLAEKFIDVEFVYPVHLNPNVQTPVYLILKNIKNIHLFAPLNYPDLIWLMEKSYIVLTDSGGIQEEAPSLGKPVLVMRDVTERNEGIDVGNAKLVGTNKEKIIEEVTKLLIDKNAYSIMQNIVNPYGEGNSSIKIYDIIKNVSL